MKELTPRVKASMKYNQANVKQIKLSLNKKTDSDVIAILESKDNVQGYIKDLIRRDNGNQAEWIEHTSKGLSDLGYFLCSNCKRGFQRIEKGIRTSDVPYINGQPYELHAIDKYCPNCGSAMKNHF